MSNPIIEIVTTAPASVIEVPTGPRGLRGIQGDAGATGATGPTQTNASGLTTGTVDNARLPEASNAAAVAARAPKAWLPLNVKDFGAVGDGTTDDTAAIQACIDAACGGAAGAEPSPIRYAIREVYTPSGVYRTTAPLLIKSVIGFVMRGAGIRQSLIAVDGSIVNAITVIGAPTLVLEDFKVCSVGGWTGTDAITAGAIALDFTPAQSAAWGGSATINRVLVEDVKFKYGFTLGLNSSGYDLADIHLMDCIVNGKRVLDSDDTTLFQAGYYSSNQTGGNPLNHYYTHCIGSGLRRLYHIASINTVSIRGGSATGCDSVIHKSGICTFSYKDSRVEENRRLFTSDANNWSNPSIISMENITWCGSAEATDRIIFHMAENGLVTLKNILLNQSDTDTDTVADWLFSFTGGSSKGSHLLIDGIITTNATLESLLSIGGGTKLFAEVRGMSQATSSGLSGTCVGRKILVYNDGPTDQTPASGGGGSLTGVVYSAGWADLGGAYPAATWYKDMDGYIRLTGLLKRTGTTISAGYSGAIFTLPVGARPAGTEQFMVAKDATVVFCEVGADGVCQFWVPYTWTSEVSSMCLSGMMFRAA